MRAFSAHQFLLEITITSCRLRTDLYSGIPTNLSSIVAHEIDLATKHIKFYWKNDSDQLYGSISNLKKSIETKGKN